MSKIAISSNFLFLFFFGSFANSSSITIPPFSLLQMQIATQLPFLLSYQIPLFLSLLLVSLFFLPLSLGLPLVFLLSTEVIFSCFFFELFFKNFSTGSYQRLFGFWGLLSSSFSSLFFLFFLHKGFENKFYLKNLKPILPFFLPTQPNQRIIQAKLKIVWETHVFLKSSPCG